MIGSAGKGMILDLLFDGVQDIKGEWVARYKVDIVVDTL